MKTNSAGERRQVVVNADDFGISIPISDAIVACHRAGSVSSTTLMVNMPGARHAARLAADCPGLGVGLHFNLTLGAPVCGPERVPALVDAHGQFHPRGTLMKRLLTGRVPRRQVRDELAAQLDRFHSLELQPTHIDSHQHVHVVPMVFDLVAETCTRAGIPIRVPWVTPIAGSRQSIGRRIRTSAMKAMIAVNRRRWRGLVSCNQSLGSLFDIDPGTERVTADHYDRVLSATSRAPLELMVHPIGDAADADGLTSIGKLAQAEGEFLATGQLPALLAESGWDLVNFKSGKFPLLQ
ncbi:MAG TPA: ChbG/HpnK family deacetylase [Thioalkalivibrio sp.]|nr:ChbG/HpnK family deacetylase [Thioalkalivibrio sp.]